MIARTSPILVRNTIANLHQAQFFLLMLVTAHSIMQYTLIRIHDLEVGIARGRSLDVKNTPVKRIELMCSQAY